MHRLRSMRDEGPDHAVFLDVGMESCVELDFSTDVRVDGLPGRIA